MKTENKHWKRRKVEGKKEPGSFRILISLIHRTLELPTSRCLSKGTVLIFFSFQVKFQEQGNAQKLSAPCNEYWQEHTPGQLNPIQMQNSIITAETSFMPLPSPPLHHPTYQATTAVILFLYHKLILLVPGLI